MFVGVQVKREFLCSSRGGGFIKDQLRLHLRARLSTLLARLNARSTGAGGGVEETSGIGAEAASLPSENRRVPPLPAPEAPHDAVGDVLRDRRAPVRPPRQAIPAGRPLRGIPEDGVTLFGLPQALLLWVNRHAPQRDWGPWVADRCHIVRPTGAGSGSGELRSLTFRCCPSRRSGSTVKRCNAKVVAYRAGVREEGAEEAWRLVRVGQHVDHPSMLPEDIPLHPMIRPLMETLVENEILARDVVLQCTSLGEAVTQLIDMPPCRNLGEEEEYCRRHTSVLPQTHVEYRIFRSEDPVVSSGCRHPAAIAEQPQRSWGAYQRGSGEPRVSNEVLQQAGRTTEREERWESLSPLWESLGLPRKLCRTDVYPSHKWIHSSQNRRTTRERGDAPNQIARFFEGISDEILGRGWGTLFDPAAFDPMQGAGDPTCMFMTDIQRQWIREEPQLTHQLMIDTTFGVLGVQRLELGALVAGSRISGRSLPLAFFIVRRGGGGEGEDAGRRTRVMSWVLTEFWRTVAELTTTPKIPRSIVTDCDPANLRGIFEFKFSIVREQLRLARDEVQGELQRLRISESEERPFVAPRVCPRSGDPILFVLSNARILEEQIRVVVMAHRDGSLRPERRLPAAIRRVDRMSQEAARPASSDIGAPSLRERMDFLTVFQRELELCETIIGDFQRSGNERVHTVELAQRRLVARFLRPITVEFTHMRNSACALHWASVRTDLCLFHVQMRMTSFVDLHRAAVPDEDREALKRLLRRALRAGWPMEFLEITREIFRLLQQLGGAAARQLREGFVRRWFRPSRLLLWPRFVRQSARYRSNNPIEQMWRLVKSTIQRGIRPRVPCRALVHLIGKPGGRQPNNLLALTDRGHREAMHPAGRNRAIAKLTVSSREKVRRAQQILELLRRCSDDALGRLFQQHDEHKFSLVRGLTGPGAGMRGDTGDNVGERRCTVDLDRGTCDCEDWQRSGLVCKHLLAVNTFASERGLHDCEMSPLDWALRRDADGVLEPEWDGAAPAAEADHDIDGASDSDSDMSFAGGGGAFDPDGASDGAADRGWESEGAAETKDWCTERVADDPNAQAAMLGARIIGMLGTLERADMTDEMQQHRNAAYRSVMAFIRLQQNQEEMGAQEPPAGARVEATAEREGRDAQPVAHPPLQLDRRGSHSQNRAASVAGAAAWRRNGRGRGGSLPCRRAATRRRLRLRGSSASPDSRPASRPRHLPTPATEEGSPRRDGDEVFAERVPNWNPHAAAMPTLTGIVGINSPPRAHNFDDDSARAHRGREGRSSRNNRNVAHDRSSSSDSVSDESDWEVEQSRSWIRQTPSSPRVTDDLAISPSHRNAGSTSPQGIPPTRPPAPGNLLLEAPTVAADTEVVEIMDDAPGISAQDREDRAADIRRRLRQGGHLNDVIVDRYFESLQTPYGRHGCLFVNSFVLPAAMNRSSRRGTHRLCPPFHNIGDFQRIFFPYCSHSHWMLVVADISQRTIRFYDPAAAAPGSDEANEARLLVVRAAASVLEGHGITLDWEFEVRGDRLPQQTNGDDCGVFVCRFAQLLAQGEALSGSRRCRESHIRHMRDHLATLMEEEEEMP